MRHLRERCWAAPALMSRALEQAKVGAPELHLEFGLHPVPVNGDTLADLVALLPHFLPSKADYLIADNLFILLSKPQVKPVTASLPAPVRHPKLDPRGWGSKTTEPAQAEAPEPPSPRHPSAAWDRCSSHRRLQRGGAAAPGEPGRGGGQ